MRPCRAFFTLHCTLFPLWQAGIGTAAQGPEVDAWRKANRAMQVGHIMWLFLLFLGDGVRCGLQPLALLRAPCAAHVHAVVHVGQVTVT